eukprot:Em0012g897a
MLHSGAAILKIAEMEYSGANGIFLRALLDKKYALPTTWSTPCSPSLVPRPTMTCGNQGLGTRLPRPLPVLWQQSLLTFVQRHKEDMSLEQKEGLMDLVRVKTHHEISHKFGL